MKLILYSVLFLVSSLGSWWANRSMKKKLERSLKKKVHQADILSISTWMKVDDEARNNIIDDRSLTHSIQEAMENLGHRRFGNPKEPRLPRRD